MGAHVVLFAGWRPQKAPHDPSHHRISQRPDSFFSESIKKLANLIYLVYKIYGKTPKNLCVSGITVVDTRPLLREIPITQNLYDME
jgi:hypothetical protein